MKYTLNCYGWQMEAIGKSLTDEQVSKIKEFMNENGYENLWEARFELDQLLDIDIWDGELFHLSKAFDNGGMNFVIEDEEGKDVLKFDIQDMLALDEVIDDYYTHNRLEEYNAFPNENGNNNVLLMVDENKGGLYYMNFESDDVPTVEDFTFMTGSIVTPEGDYDYIDKIFFKTVELEIEDYLDNSGKASTVELFTSDGGVIN
jgi:hypothetical protein